MPREIIHAYDPLAPLEAARTPPSAWYTDSRIFELERQSVFATTWQVAARLEQVRDPGQFVTMDVAGEPIVVVRGNDGALRAFHNVCRHHAAAVVTAPEGCCSVLRCPYHGWSYGLDGTLKGTPDFDGVQGFDRKANGLSPVRVGCWENLVAVCLDPDAASLEAQIADFAPRVAALDLAALTFIERRTWELDCNWKVYVDNYLDGGYHVPHLHRGLDTVIDYASYEIEIGQRACLQTSPMVVSGADADLAAVRGGQRAHYLWVYPNLMLNAYAGYLDVNLVVPLAVNRTRVIFDFYLDAQVADDASRRNASLAVAEQVQQEDVDICEAVQRGLQSRAYDTGRLSVRREAGEHLFHRLVHGDLAKAIA